MTPIPSGTRVLVREPSGFAGLRGTVRQHYEATDNYLVEYGTSTVWIPAECLEVLA